MKSRTSATVGGQRGRSLSAGSRSGYSRQSPEAVPRSRPRPPKKSPVPSPAELEAAVEHAYVTTGFSSTSTGNWSNSPIIDRIDDALEVWADGLPTTVALGIGYLGFQKLRHLLHEAVK